MKKISFFLFSILAIFFAACSDNKLMEDGVPQKDGARTIEYSEISALVKELYNQNPFATADEIDEAVQQKFKISVSETKTRSLTEQEGGISSAALLVVDEMQGIDAGLFSTKQDYIAELESVVLKNTELTVEESCALLFACKLSADILELKYGLNGEPATRGFGSWIKGQWESWGKCASGIVGGAGVGALGGAAAGSAVPIIGTTVGGIVGGISGGLSGAAAAC